MLDVSAVIANNIRDLRKSKAMTQSDLASELGYTVQAISRWEKGKSLPDPVMLYRLALCFGVEVAYFYQDNHLEVDLEKEKIIRKRENLFRLIVLLSVLLAFGLLATTIVLFVATSVVYIILWTLSFLSIGILLLGLVLRNQKVIQTTIPIIIVTLFTSFYFSLKDHIANLKYIFIPMTVILLAYFLYFLFFRRN